MKKILIIIVLIVAVTAVVWHRAARAAETTVYCPLISDIHKNNTTENWYAHTTTGSWQSYHTSFANQLTEFLGAQWVGVKIGQVACVYQAAQKFKVRGTPVLQPVFPIHLIFHDMVLQPSGGKWQQHQKTEAYNCRPRTQADLPFDQSDCAFQMRLEKPAGSFDSEVEDLR